jgi:zinc transport system substrate-binding protein
MFSRIVLILAVVVVVGLSGCGSGGSGGGTSVVAAFYPLAYAAEKTGGNGYRIENLTPAGAEPHDLELSPREVGAIESAAVVLYLSHGFQPAVSKAVERARGKRVDALAGLPLRNDDPHVWLDPVMFERVVRKIGIALQRPAGPAVAELKQLDRAYRKGLHNCARREIVTSHAAFGYLAARYGLRQVAITGTAPESEPSPQQLTHVVDVVRRTQATTVFSEPLVSPRLAETVAREVGARKATLDPIEALTADEEKRGDDYVTLMQRNLTALRKALGCR